MTSARRSKPSNQPTRKFPLAPVVFGAIAIVLVVTVILTFNSGGNGTNAFGTPTITGAPLPTFGDGTDPAIGMTIPSVTGEDFNGNTVEITNDGRPKVIMMIAHWCPHCQNEVPVVEAWLQAGNLPDGVDIYSVATGTSSTRDNYPPSAWLEREGWTVPVIADSDKYEVAAAFGLNAYPYWVFVNADDTVAARTTGELSTDVLDQITAGLVSGG